MMTDFNQQIGPFRLYSEIGRTPISTKYRAIDSRNGETVVLHVLTADAAQQPTIAEIFLAIGRQAMRLRHPGIVAVLETGEAQGFVYIATQWINGHSVGERLRRTSYTIEIETAAYITNSLAAALDYAHSQGIIHGHITLDQIYVTDNNTIMLDGFAESAQIKLTTTTQAGEQIEEVIKSPLVFISPLIAPEQATADHPLDFRADIYSLGAALYTMVLGRPPFTTEDSQELLSEIVEKLPTAPEAINPTLPAAMVYVLKLVLVKDPAMRYASAGELANAFQQSSQWRTTTPTEAQAETYERRGLAAIILLLLVAVLSFILISGVGLGWFGERFAFLQHADGTGAVAEWRAWFLPSQGTAQSTDEAVVQIPVVLVTLTPATDARPNPSVAQATTVAGSQPLSDTVSTRPLTTTALITDTTDTDVIETDATETSVMTTTPALGEIATRTVTATVENFANASEAARPLVIDPLRLLRDAVAAGNVIVNGTAAPGAPIQLQVNGRPSGSTTTKATGTWSLIVTLDQPGDYAITAQLLDGNGNVAETTQQIVTVAPPTEILTATLTATQRLTQPMTVSPTVSVTVSATVPVTSTPSATPTAPLTVTPTNSVQPTATATNTAPPTATSTLTPTATATHTPLPTATATHTPRPTATVTNTPLPTATATLQPTATNTPLPTATNTNTVLPTVTQTNTPRPTATNTPQPSATATVQPTVTNTALPTVTRTNTPRPTATLTSTPRATATNTPRPTATATHTATPTATHTPLPTATDTPAPTATATNTAAPTATNTPRPTPTTTRTPTATHTPLPPPTPTVVSGSVEPISPNSGDSGSGQQMFSWSANFTPPAEHAFELVFWKPGQDPLVQSIGMAAPTSNLNVTLDLARLDEQLGGLFDTGEYNWGVLLVRTTPAYERVRYLGGGRNFIYYRSSNSGSGGQSSGE